MAVKKWPYRRALSGAASYVPKIELARHLLDTVQNVFSASRCNRQHARLMECAQRRELSFVLENDSSLIPPLVDQLQQTISSLGLVDERHAYRWPSPWKKRY